MRRHRSLAPRRRVLADRPASILVLVLILGPVLASVIIPAQDAALAALAPDTSPAPLTPAVDDCILEVPVCGQEQSEWCWAGTSQAMLEYYGYFYSQYEIAEYGTEGANIWNWLWGSSTDPTRRGIDMILEYFGDIDSAPYAYALSLAQSSAEICGLHPFVIRWGWTGGGGHFLVGHGVSDSNMLHYMDPLPIGYGGAHVASYDWVVLGSNHEWTHSLATIPPVSGVVAIDAEPAEADGHWELLLPDATTLSGSGDAEFTNMQPGQYTITWLPSAGWRSPQPSVQDITLSMGRITFAGTYGFPFTELTGDPLGDPGPGRGAALIDFEGDGDVDIYVVNHGQSNQLLRNDGGLLFTDIASGPIAHAGPTQASSWCDFDNDGDLDVYLSVDGEANLLLQNDGGGSFSDITPAMLANADPGRGVSWADVDGDGLADLFLANGGASDLLLKSWGDFGTGWVFTGYPGFTGDAGNGICPVWADYDGDGDPDLYLTRDADSNILYRNDGSFGLTDVTGTGFLADGGTGTGAAWGDFDNDGDQDLYFANNGQMDALLANSGGSFSLVLGDGLRDGGAGRGVVWADLDNDGFLDLYVTRNQQTDLLLRGNGTGGFQIVPVTNPGTDGPGCSVTAGDLDGDGDLDLFVVQDGGANLLLRNDQSSGNHWLEVDLEGDGIVPCILGTSLELFAGTLHMTREVRSASGYFAQDPLTVHFGLGSNTADSLRVRWPDGEVQILRSVATDQRLTVHRDLLSDAGDTAPPAPSYSLRPNYPNPFNPSTTIAFSLPARQTVDLAIYSLDGRCVATLVRGEMAAGDHRLAWRGTDDGGMQVASGTYFCRLVAGGFQQTRRMTLVR
jgi:hypothetical protein